MSEGNAVDTVTALRRAQLQARCEAQRIVLAGHVADIERRLQGTDTVLGTIRSIVTRPSVLAGGMALLMTMGRSGWWSKLSRGAVLFATARRVYQAFKHK